MDFGLHLRAPGGRGGHPTVSGSGPSLSSGLFVYDFFLGEGVYILACFFVPLHCETLDDGTAERESERERDG